MRRDTTSWYSHNLGMEMPLVAYGHAGYPLLMFHRRLRPWGIAGILALHVGIATMMGLVSFGVVMAVRSHRPTHGM